jgi:hypothetical protein
MQPHGTGNDHDGGPGFWRRLRCSMRSRHDPVHHPLGGFRCSRCGRFGATLEQLGFEDEGYVSEKERRRLARNNGDSNRAA